MEMKCIFDIEKKNSILAKATQVSDVAHGPLVCNCCYKSVIKVFDFTDKTETTSRRVEELDGKL
jgi:hypothetical protein